jgi:hypothetical protein
VTVATTTMTTTTEVAAKKKTKAVTHRQELTKIGSGRNVGGGGNGNGNDNGNDDDGNGDNGNDDNNDGNGSCQRATAAADSKVWGRRYAAGGDRNGNQGEMGTMWV